VDVGLEDSEALAALNRVLSDEVQRKKISHELCEIFRDQYISWVNLLDNEDYVVYSADDEDDAKAYFVKLIWNVVFPATPVP
jgi:hypothetical protein